MRPVAACLGLLALAIAVAAQAAARDPRGEAALRDYGCGACHTIAGIRGADADIGPPLVDFRDRRLIAGRLPNTLPNLMRWLENPQAVAPGSVMPDLGVAEPQARDLAAYLYSH